VADTTFAPLAAAWHWLAREVQWGECDPFGLVYYPHMLAWFNDAEHALWRSRGRPIEQMIAVDRTTFVMGAVDFRFTGPARYGEGVACVVAVDRIGRSSLGFRARVARLADGAPVCHGTARRIYAHVGDDGSLAAAPIPDDLRRLLVEAGVVPDLPAMVAGLAGAPLPTP